MQDYQKDFIKLAIDHNVLSFGEFTLKSGRISPYFFNAGRFQTGAALAALGQFYAQALINSSLKADILFGPAYKGIPLVTTTAAALSNKHNLDFPVCFNRKEAKDHGEGGTLIGAPLKGKVLIIDDVITAGTAVREVIDLILDQGAEPSGVMIGLDRQEKGQGKLSSIQEIENSYKIPVISIIKLEHIIDYVSDSGDNFMASRMTEYRDKYGV
jgi:orotate phosphoribosyltransferase